VIDVRFTSLPTWPHGDTWDRRPRHTFKAPWSSTLELLDRELRLLDASEIIIGVNLNPRHIRLDGWPRGDAPHPVHPGVELSFNSGAVARLDPLVRRGHALIRRYGGDATAALKRCHPDIGGSHEDFVALQAATDPSKRLVYATDACVYWQHNVRSIALGLEALRAVDRYGITRKGEQYAGFRAALSAGSAA
jgi:hypothetical protein